MTVQLKPHAPHESPGTTGLAARLSFFPRLPLMAGVGAFARDLRDARRGQLPGTRSRLCGALNGNIVFLAFTLEHARGPEADVAPARQLAALCGGPGVLGRGGRQPAAGWYDGTGQQGSRLAFPGDAGLIGVAAVVIALTHPGPAGQARSLVIGILAVAMGMQNVLIRRWGILDLATNAMTKTMAYLVADSALGGRDDHHAMRRGVSIVIFTAGAAVGAFLSRYGVLWPILTAFTLFVLALPILLQPPGQQPGG